MTVCLTWMAVVSLRRTMQAVDDGYQLVLRPPAITIHETRNMRVRLYLSALKRYKSWHVVQRAVMLESR
jgi:hypothetical protein